MAHLLFLDESGFSQGADFVLGGIAVEMARWQQCWMTWSRELRGQDGNFLREVKWTGTRSLDGKAGRLIEMIQAAEATAFAVVVKSPESRDAAPELFGTPEDAYRTALMFIAERYQRLLERVDSHGLVVIDGRGASRDDGLRRFFAHMAAEGTDFQDLDRILAPILLSSSHFALGIQAADLVVGSLFTLIRRDADEISAERVAFAEEVHGRLRACFDRHPHTGELSGVGIKRFPGPVVTPTGKLFQPDV